MSLLTRTVTGLQSRVVRLGGRRAEGSVDGLPLALLTTRGRYAREQRTVPLPYVEDGDRIVLAASSAGSNLHPAWYQNLVADPEVTFEVRGAHRQMRASVASESERARIYDAFKRRSPRYARYEQKSARTIPVVLLREAPRAARDLHAA